MRALLLTALSLAGAAQAAPRPELTIQTRSASMVNSLAVSPDGKLAAAADIANNVKLWDLETGALLRTIKAHGQFGVRMAFALGGTTLVTGSLDRVAFWDLETGKERDEARLTMPFSISSMGLSRDGRWLALAGSRFQEAGEVQLWDTGKGEMARTFKGELAALSPDGRFLVTGGAPRERSEDGGPGKAGPAPLEVWDPATGKRLRSLGSQVVLGLSISPDGVLVVHQDDQARAFDLKTGRALGTIQPPNPDGKGFIRFVQALGKDKLAVGWVKELQLWSASTSRRLKTLSADNQVMAATPIPKGGVLVAEMRGGALTVWDLESGEKGRRLEGRSDNFDSVSFSAGGKYLAMATGRTAFLLDLAGQKPIKTFANSYRIAVSADEASILTASFDPKAGELRTIVRSLKTGKVLSSIKNQGPVLGAVLGAAPVLLTYEQDKSVAAWTPTGRKLSEFRLPWQMSAFTPRLALAPDGREAMAVVGENGDALKSMDLSTGKTGEDIPTGGNLIAVAVGPGLDPIVGGYSLGNLIYASKDALHIDAQGRFEEEGKEAPKSDAERMLMVSALAVSPDGALLAGAGGDNFVRVWDMGSKELVAELRGHEASVRAIAFSPDNALLATAGSDDTARLWDLKTGRELCRIIPVGEGWVAVSPEGFFDGTSEALQSVRWTMGLKSYPLEAFSEGYYVPELLPKLLAGAPLSAQKASDLSKGFSLPPSVEFTAPQVGAELDRADLEVQVTASDEGGGIDEVRLYHNGKAVGGETRGMKRTGKAQTTRTFQLVLVDGVNALKAVALSRDRIEGNPAEVSVTYKGAARKPTLHLMVVGINEYKNEALNLNYAQPDARGIADFFSGGTGLFAEIKKHELYDRGATKAALVAQLKAFAATAPEDVVIVYLAGHGESIEDTWYFLPHELVYPEKEDAVRKGGLSSAELQGYIKDIGARKVVVLMDACKSGGAMAAFAGRGVEDRKALAQLARAAGVHVMAASTKDQIAAEVKDLGHGVFTHTLLAGLQQGADGSPKDGTVTIRELVSYVESQLPEVSAKYKTQAQYPVVDSRGMDFPVSRAR